MEEESLNWHLGYLVLGLAQTWANNYEKTLPLGKIAENKIWKKAFFPYIYFVRFDYGEVLEVGHEKTSQYLNRVVTL